MAKGSVQFYSNSHHSFYQNAPNYSKRKSIIRCIYFLTFLTVLILITQFPFHFCQNSSCSYFNLNTKIISNVIDKQFVMNATVVKREMFPPDFFFGTASGAYQVEGAYDEGGRGLSIWDALSRTPGKTFNGDTGDVAIDQYHRYWEDIALMKELGVDAYRFSISWPRIYPNGRGDVNPEGVAYYNRLIDALIKNGITPYITIFHWDVPLTLQQEFGGFLSDKIIPLFVKFADTCFSEFGDRVKNWITFNEPLAFCNVGHSYGEHAPARCSNRTKCAEGWSSVEPYLVAHNLLRSHAYAAQVFRTKHKPRYGGIIGIAVDMEWAEPRTESNVDVAAAQRKLEFTIGWMIDPVTRGDYPAVMKRQVNDRLPKFSEREKWLLKNSIDFIGINHYTSSYVYEGHPPLDLKTSTTIEDIWINVSPEDANGVLIGSPTPAPWIFVVPWGMEKVIMWLSERYNNMMMIVTENGRSELNDPSLPLFKALDDNERLVYINDYLLSVARALQKGANVQGYFAWTFSDNFEWVLGYSHRFGLYFVDYENNLKRHPKKSAKWFSKFLRYQDWKGGEEENSM